MEIIYIIKNLLSLYRDRSSEIPRPRAPDPGIRQNPKSSPKNSMDYTFLAFLIALSSKRLKKGMLAGLHHDIPSPRDITV